MRKVLLTWALVAVRAVPGLERDRGIFVSTAERLLAGDRLYVEAWDNKDPLFYYVLAAGRMVSPLMDVVVELTWLLIACLAALALGRHLGCSTAQAVLGAFVVTPVILTGAHYIAGYTNLPGTALTLLALALSVNRRYAAGGAVLGVLLFLKITNLPLAVAMVAVVVIRRRARRGGAVLAAGFVAAAGVIAALLQWRGELTPYLQTLRDNLTYAQGPLIDPAWAGIPGHLGRVLLAGAVTTVVATVLILVIDRWLLRGGSDLWPVAAVGLAVAMGILAVSGMWPHHAQILYAPAVLTGLLVVRHLPEADRPAAIATAVLTGVLLAGGTPLFHPALPDDLAGRTAALPPGSYARVGLNDDFGHAYGLRDRELACPRFAQYPFDSPEVLAQTADCLPQADVILVAPSAVPDPQYPAWNAYLEGVERLLQQQYSCQPRDGARICTRTNI